MCFYEISVHPIIIHQIVFLARVLYKRNPAATCMRDLFLNTVTFKGGQHWFCILIINIILFLLYSQLFQISKIFENVFRKLPDSVVLQPSDKKDRIIRQINVFISSNYYEFSGGVEEFVDTRFQHHCRLKAHSVISYKTIFRKLSSPRGGEGIKVFERLRHVYFRMF